MSHVGKALQHEIVPNAAAAAAPITPTHPGRPMLKTDVTKKMIKPVPVMNWMAVSAPLPRKNCTAGATG